MTGSSRGLPRPARAGLALIPVLALHFGLAQTSVGVSPDSVFYWSAARTVLAEGRVATGITMRAYVERLPDGPGPTPLPAGWSASGPFPLSAWPPGYPVALAAVSLLTKRNVNHAAVVVNLLALAASVILMGRLAERVVGLERAWWVAAFVGVLPFMQDVSRMMWSEPLFWVATLGVCLGLQEWMARPERMGAAVGAATAAAAGTYVKYLGVGLGGAVLLVALWRLVTRRPRALVQCLATGGTWLALVAPLALRNLDASGYISGAERLASAPGPWNALLNTGFAMAAGVVPMLRNATPGASEVVRSAAVSLGAWVVAALLIVVVLAIVVRFGRGREPVAPQPAPPARGAVLPLYVVAGTYLFLIALLRARWTIGVDVRQVSPALVCGMLALVSWTVGRLPVRIARLAVPLSVAAAMGVTDVTLRFAGSMGYDWHVFNARHFRDSPIAVWIRQTVGSADESVALVVVDGYLVPQLHYATGRRLESYPSPAQLPGALESSPAGTVVVITAPFESYSSFPCARYQTAYEGLLDTVSDSVVRARDFAAWWLRAGPDRRASPVRFPARNCSAP